MDDNQCQNCGSHEIQSWKGDGKWNSKTEKYDLIIIDTVKTVIIVLFSVSILYDFATAEYLMDAIAKAIGFSLAYFLFVRNGFTKYDTKVVRYKCKSCKTTWDVPLESKSA